MTVKLVKNCTFTGDPGLDRCYLLGMDGYIGRAYGQPPELLPNCHCGIPTVVDGEIVGKIFYGTRRRLYVWCKEHEPWWWRFRMAYQQWLWRLFRVGVPLHGEPDIFPRGAGDDPA